MIFCRWCNGKQQRTRRGGRSVQRPNWFMILHSSSRHVCTNTYALGTTKYIRRKKEKNPRPEVRSRDGHIQHVCKKTGSICKKRCGHLHFCAENMCILRSCLWLLGFSLGSSFCVAFHLVFKIGRSDLRMYAWNFLQTRLGVPGSRLVQKQNGEKKSFPTETPDQFRPCWWPVVGGDTFSPLAPIVGPEKKSGHVTLFYCSWGSVWYLIPGM